MLNPLWIFKQNISSLICQNKCTMQTLGNLCCLGLGFPSHRVSLRQTVASPGVAEVTVREMQSTGRTQPPATAYFCAMPVPVLACLWAWPQQNFSTCKFLSAHSWFQVAAGASECLWQPCQKIWVEFGTVSQLYHCSFALPWQFKGTVEWVQMLFIYMLNYRGRKRL